MPSYLLKKYIIYIYMYVIKYVFQRLNALDLRITLWEGGELSYPARPQNQSRESHPNLTSQAGSGGAVTQRQLWLAWVEPGGTTPTPTWTKAAPRELVSGKLWDDMEGLEVLVRPPLPLILKCAGHTGAHLQFTEMSQGLLRWQKPTWKHQGNISEELRGVPVGRQQLHSAFIGMHAAWATTRRSWKSPSAARKLCMHPGLHQKQ